MPYSSPEATNTGVRYGSPVSQCESCMLARLLSNGQVTLELCTEADQILTEISHHSLVPSARCDG